MLFKLFCIVSVTDCVLFLALELEPELEPALELEPELEPALEVEPEPVPELELGLEFERLKF
jgi:hypothetical protein